MPPSNKSMERRRKQLLSYQSCSLNSGLRVAGFRLAHLNRYKSYRIEFSGDFFERETLCTERVGKFCERKNLYTERNEDFYKRKSLCIEDDINSIEGKIFRTKGDGKFTERKTLCAVSRGEFFLLQNRESLC